MDQAPPLAVPFRFFVTAPLFGVLGGLYLAVRAPEVAASALMGPAIAWVHLWTLGWLALIMLGAVYQMIPVMIGGQVPLPRLSVWVYGLVSLGVLALVGFFESYLPWLGGLGLAGLGLGFGLFLVQIAVALARVGGVERPTLRAMRLSIGSLSLVWGLGLARLAEYLGAPGLPGAVREAHLSLALIGWVMLLVFGVSFHLIPMFYVCPGFDRERAFRVLRWVGLGLLFLVGGLLGGLAGTWLWVPLGMVGLGVGLYLLEYRRVVQGRRRKKIDPSLRLFSLAMGGLGLAGISALLGVALDSQRWVQGAGLLFLFAFALPATHAMLYKIVPFLIWFHRYSSRIGQAGVPLVADLLEERDQSRETLLLLGSLGLLALGFALPHSGLAQLAGVGLALDHGYLLYLFLNALRAHG